jgi:hypothetical protein
MPNFQPPAPPPPAVDGFYSYEPDDNLARLATGILVNAGYRPFKLVRRDIDRTEHVWAKREEDVGRYAAGATIPLVMTRSTLYRPEVNALVLDAEDNVYAPSNRRAN